MSDDKQKSFYAYMVKCVDSSLYSGWTQDLEKRIMAHNQGLGAKYTRSRRPVELVASWQFETKSEAMKFEVYLKRLGRQEKLNLIL
jgi:putative endonuclease